ncbi:MAG: hypothetical protein EBQ99_10990, partial [Planctomycetes bacterium]|nr:hypothetical protein [Planctomycetota bacterium]
GQTNTPGNATGVTQVACGGYHTYALKGDGTLVGWGTNGSGQTSTPANLNNVTQVACGASYTYALKNNGTLLGWGYNDYGQTNTPADLNNVTQVACGYAHTYALKGDGTLVGWGYNGNGETNTPANLNNVTQVACGYAHTYALKGDGTLVGWGSNYYGQTNTPTTAANITQIACGNYHTYALKPWSDCNGNAIFDSDDIASGLEWDLNNDGRPDACGQGVAAVRLASGSLGVPTANVARSFTFPLSHRADAPVGLRIHAVGDLEAGTEFITVRLNGVVLKRCFETGGQGCAGGQTNQDTIQIPTADFNALVDAGGFTVGLLPSPAVSASECSSGDMWITIDYPGIAADGDCNANGVLDVREIGGAPALDLNRDARIDACQIAADPSLDCNGNGRIDAFDIASGETDDNGNGRIDLCEYAKGDFDLSGEVDAA